MLIDIEKNQNFLALLYSLQNNESNAVLQPICLARIILNKKVYFYKLNNEYVYSLKPNFYLNEKKARKKGGRPKIQLDNYSVMYLKFECGNSNRQIAKILQVSEGTIRNFFKELKAENVKISK